MSVVWAVYCSDTGNHDSNFAHLVVCVVELLNCTTNVS